VDGEREEELNVQSAYGGPAADRIEEILNAEKLDTCLRRYDNIIAGMTEKRVGHRPTLQKSNGGHGPPYRRIKNLPGHYYDPASKNKH